MMLISIFQFVSARRQANWKEQKIIWVQNKQIGKNIGNLISPLPICLKNT